MDVPLTERALYFPWTQSEMGLRRKKREQEGIGDRLMCGMTELSPSLLTEMALERKQGDEKSLKHPSLHPPPPDPPPLPSFMSPFL